MKTVIAINSNHLKQFTSVQFVYSFVLNFMPK